MITVIRVLPFNNNYEEVWKQYIIFIFIDVPKRNEFIYDDSQNMLLHYANLMIKWQKRIKCILSCILH